MKLSDDIDIATSTVEEYKNAELWIEAVMEGIDSKWSNIQKIAYIDNEIGKKISYSPDFDTEVFNEGDARALWRIINSGYGICNGIAQIEKYMFNKIGIDADVVSSEVHSFLRLNNIELPTKTGELVKGNTILDPTWNLSANKFGSYPNNFCISYEDIRNNDIKSDGTDSEAHKNDEELLGATLSLDEYSLREVYKSIGIADKDGNFPIKELIELSDEIYSKGYSKEETIKRQFSLLAKYCPDFASFQNSTTNILQGVLLNNENLKFNKCVVNRVYNREDENREAVLYVYVDLPQIGGKFYYADKKANEFFELPKKEFEEKFECYELDIQRNKGFRNWENSEKEEKIEDLTKSSGKIISYKGEER